jgi:drug/metabolite transporter (DMT)-like permease
MRRGMTRTRAVVVALFVAFLWSTSWVLIKMGLKDIPALTFAGLRYSLASLCLVPVVLLARGRFSVQPPPRRLWLPLVGLGVLLYAGTQGAMFLALTYLPAVSVNLLWSFSTVAVALFGIVWPGERPTALQCAGIGLAMLGVILYYYPAGIRVGERAGLAVCGIGVLANAGAAILGRSINRSRDVSPLIVTIISMSIGSAALLPTEIGAFNRKFALPRNGLAYVFSLRVALVMGLVLRA